MLKLKRFRVTSFRSVRDSGWIEADDVTALIGTNESGKTNLLIPLWKLNPAKEGEIDPIADYPRAEYNRMRDEDQSRVFITADFEPDADLRSKLVTLTGFSPAFFDVVRVARSFDGERTVTFPAATPMRMMALSEVSEALASTSASLTGEKTAKKDEGLKSAMITALATAMKRIEGMEQIDADMLRQVEADLNKVSIAEASETSTLPPRWRAISSVVAEFVERVTKPSPEEVDGTTGTVLESLPAFVYYSNYGNLDSEIYLPHVIANMKRSSLGAKEAAKARTLKVLFEYVRLSPEEILKLGAPAAEKGVAATQDMINAAMERTKERDILLRSADTELTKAFKEWWKQGDYRFRFAADGDHFRIWVSDDRRPEDIELESRSTGLQWFFSFFLVFLVERRDAHKGAILLLDEPGLSLHPLSQRDLSAFFENLSQTNPVIYTTHSPFLVDADHLDRVRLVYVDTDGATAVSSNLRAQAPNTAEGRSVYAVHAALGLSVSTTLFQGCTTVVVEGPSDQFYLSAMKIALIAHKRLAPRREILFVPAGGAKGTNAIVPIVTAKDENVPFVILDDDGQGRQFAEALRQGPLYKNDATRILNVRSFVAGNFEFAEIEDLVPTTLLADVVSRLVRGPNDDFRDIARSGRPIVPQIEEYAARNSLVLPTGWKADLARAAKQRILRDIDKIAEATLDSWARLFGHFQLAGS